MTRALAVSSVVVLLVGVFGYSERAAPVQATADVSEPPAPRDLKGVLDQFTTALLKEFPDVATSLAVSEDVAGGKYSNRLVDLSPKGVARRAQLLRTTREELAKIDRTRLSAADTVTYDVLAAHLDYALAAQKFGLGDYHPWGGMTPYVVTQIHGAYVDIPDFLDSQHAVNTVQDAEDYLARLRAFATMLDQETAQINVDADKGIVPPDFVIDGAVRQLNELAAQVPAESVLVQALKRKVAEAKFEPTEQASLVGRAENATKELVLPAYRRQAEQLKSLRPRATHDAGIWRMPNAAQYYAAALEGYNTTKLTPDEIHGMGVRLIEQLHQEMDKILDAQGLTTGTIAARIRKVAEDPEQYFPNTDEGRAQLLEALNQQIRDLQPLLPKYFGRLAKAKLEIRRVPADIEQGAPGGYYRPAALDGSRPGAYYINLRDTGEWPKASLPTLTYHEGNPGHHWQGSMAQESSELPMIRGAILDFSGYSEGWGLYAEQLADEMGVYADDPLGRLGYLQSMVYRAARLVVDTGLHHKQWTREKAIAYMVEVTGDLESSTTTEVERYAVWPGQATAYMVGRETINRLRTKAQAQLGDRFDIKTFHDVVLANGPLPLSVLETVVNAWIAEQGKVH